MKIAIIGSGISGLTCAYLFDKHHQITLYEKSDQFGGHAHTCDLQLDENSFSVDIGFIVFNHRNYPNLTGLFDRLGVETAPSDMSFGVSINNGWLEYGTPEPGKLFAQKRNLFRPEYLKMLFDIVRFNKRAIKYIERDDISLGACLEDLKMGSWFRTYFILPMGGAIWSTPVKDMLDFPASTFIRFFKNHGLLSINDQPQWFTVKGGSKHYVQAIIKQLKGDTRANCGVQKITRHQNHIELVDVNGTVGNYDHVIFACHPDQVLEILSTPNKQEKDILSSIKYQPNKVVLHTDHSFMPKRKSAWTSWSYISKEKTDQTRNMSLTYWMNNLQPLETSTDVFVTLNPHKMPAQDKILFETVFEHPIFDKQAIGAQKKMALFQKGNRVHYCGAWQQYGFHEDGCLSAVKIAEKFGLDIPWK